MNLYLDDDSLDPLLVRLLRRANHDVQLPQDVGRRGNHDAAHMRHAVLTSRVLLSHNHHDFQLLLDLKDRACFRRTSTTLRETLGEGWGRERTAPGAQAGAPTTGGDSSDSSVFSQPSK